MFERKLTVRKREKKAGINCYPLRAAHSPGGTGLIFVPTRSIYPPPHHTKASQRHNNKENEGNKRSIIHVNLYI